MAERRQCSSAAGRQPQLGDKVPLAEQRGLPCRWAEVSGRQIDLQIGDICDWEFLSQSFTVSCVCGA
jgi:UDP-sulfoquinovose synthase